LNVAKLEAGRKILLSNEVNLEDEAIYVAITATEHQSLLNEIQVISLDFNQQPVYNDKGLITAGAASTSSTPSGRGSRPRPRTTSAGSSKQMPMWVKSGMYLGIWNDINTNVSQRHDIRGEPWQAYTKMSANATRLEEKRVVKIWCR
jgi:hypothetical protein